MITTLEGVQGSGMTLTAVALRLADIEAARIQELNRKLKEPPESHKPNYYRERSQAYSLYLRFRENGGFGGLTGIN